MRTAFHDLDTFLDLPRASGPALSPDGTRIVITVVRVDVATGERTTIAQDPGADLGSPVISPDGSSVAFLRGTHSTPARAPQITLCRMVFGEPFSEIAADWNRWPTSVAWTVDGSKLLVTADEGGRAPAFVLDLGSSIAAVYRLTRDDFTYTNVSAAPRGVVYALRSSYSCPPHPVRIAPDGAVTTLPCVEMPVLPSQVTEVSAVAADGSEVRSWLVLPDGTEPAPLVLWIHGASMRS